MSSFNGIEITFNAGFAIICIVILTVLFAGDPDLMDAIIECLRRG